MATFTVINGGGDQFEEIVRHVGRITVTYKRRKAPKPGDRLLTVAEINREYIPDFTAATARSWATGCTPEEDLPRVNDPDGTMLWWESEIVAWMERRPRADNSM
jgi:hypothetical protein